MLTGSYAVEEAREDSDIDVVLLSELSSRQTTESLTHEGRIYQFVVFPCHKVRELVCQDYITAQFVFLSLFEKGLILYDEYGTLAEIRRFILPSKPWTLGDHDILSLRASVTSSLDALRGSDTLNLCTASEAVMATARLICGRKAYAGKHLDKILSEHPREAEMLHRALDGYLADKDARSFSLQLETLLRPFGGLLRNHASGYVLSAPPSSRHLLAFLPEALPSDRKIMRGVDRIVKATARFMPTVFYIGQGQVMERGIYISFHSPEGRVAEALRILEQVTGDFDFMALGYGISCPYPSCFYEGVYWGNRFLYEALAGTMGRLSALSMSLWNKGDENYRLLSAYRLVCCYVRCVVPREEVQTFWVDALNRLMPEVLDVNGMYAARRLLVRKRKFLAYMDGKYKEQEESLHSLVEDENIFYTKIDGVIRGVCQDVQRALCDNVKSKMVSSSFPMGMDSGLFSLFNHMMSVLLLNSNEKVAVVYNISRIFGGCAL